MSIIVRVTVRLYSAMIRLYPLSFRQEFGAEMLAVYVEAIEDAREKSRRDLFVTILREIRDFPSFLLREHWRNFTHLEPNLMTINRKPAWFFYPAWIILTALCVPVGVLASMFIVHVIVGLVGDLIYADGMRWASEDNVAIYALVLVVGLSTGILQYGLLRRYMPRMGWWVLATAGGWSLGLVLIVLGIFGVLTHFWGAETIYRSWAFVLAFSLLGLSIGFGQWLVLRRRLPRAGWWIGANVLGWGLLGLMTKDTRDLYWLAFGLLPACVTAATLALLMNPLTPAET
jgi:hypothetical protein